MTSQTEIRPAPAPLKFSGLDDEDPLCSVCDKPTSYWLDWGQVCESCEAYWPGLVGEPGKWFDSRRVHTVCLCGSMRFEADIQRVAENESLRGYAVVLPLVNMKLPDPRWSENQDRIKAMLDRLHKQKIRMADEVVIVAPGGYISDSTRSEIRFATALGKPIRYVPEATS